MNKIDNRVLEEANYIIKTNKTIREAAKVFNISKSTLHKDISNRLERINKEKYKEIENILRKHIEVRHIHGGQSTKLKYIKLKRGDNMHDIGIDLGTTNVLIYVKGKGIILNEPSLVAKDIHTNKIIAYGKDAKEMLGKTPENIKILCPIQDGVVADFDETNKMLHFFLKKVLGRIIIKPRILICCPSNITGIEKNALYEIGERLGARKVYVEDETKIAAIGAGIDITKPSGSMIIDIGGGTTDISVLSLGGIVVSSSIKIAGNTFDKDIIKYVKEKKNIIIGDQQAEDIKIKLKSSMDNVKEEKIVITGSNKDTGLPEDIELTKDDIDEALKKSIKKIVDEAKSVLEKTSPELTADIKEKGIILSGGGSQIDGLVEKLRKELKAPIFITDNPLTNVVEGTKIALENIYLIDN